MDQIRRIHEMIAALKKSGSSSIPGLKTLVGMLKQMDRKTERTVLEGLAKRDPELVRKLRENYFIFEDVLQMEDANVQRALQEVKRPILAMAMKGTSAVLREKIFRNLSPGAVKLLQEEMEFQGPQLRSRVEEAQREVAEVLRRWLDVVI